MCTLIVLKGTNAAYPLIVAANRDESPDRPTRGPHHMTGGIFAPQDLVLGGSWLGVNRHGLMAGLTNRWAVPHRHGCRSRGLLVMEALGHATLDGAASDIAGREPTDYNGFHLLLADGRDAAIVWHDGNDFRTERLTDGLHVVTGWGFTAGHCRRDRLVRARTAAVRDGRVRLVEMLTAHDRDQPEQGVCVHGHGIRMQSIYSMTVSRPADGSVWHVRWRDGRPCRGEPWFQSTVPIDGQRKEQQ